MAIILPKNSPSSPQAPFAKPFSKDHDPGVEPAPPHQFTHDQIAKVAEALWRAQGCPLEKDQENWLAAEAQLRNQP